MLISSIGAIASSKSNGISWSIGDATYASGPYNVGTQSTNPYDVQFGDSGTKMYVFDVGTDTIYQYTLSTPYEVGSATYASKSVLVTDEDSAPYCIALSSDGTKLYVGGDTNDSVFQYSLSPAWDISTATSDTVSDAVAAWPTGIAFKTDGTEMYTVSGVGNSITQYTLSTGWNLATSTTTGSSGSLSEDSSMRGVAISSDGTKLYALGDTNNTVYQYSLSPAYDITSISYDSVSFNISTEETSPSGLSFNDTGTNMYVTGTAGTDEVYQYTLATAWDLSTAVYIPTGTGKFADVSTEGVTPVGLRFGDNGNKLYTVHQSNNTIYQYNLSTAYDASTATYASKSKDVTSEDSNPYGVDFNPDGTIMYVCGDGTDTIYQYTLSPAWDVSTASYASKSASVATQAGNPYDVIFGDDGTKMYVLAFEDSVVYQYTIGTAWDLGGTVTYASKSLDLTTQIAVSNSGGMVITADGTTVLVTDVSSAEIFQYTLSTPWDLSTGAYASKFKDISDIDTVPRGLDLSSDETKLYVLTTGTNEYVYQFHLE